MDVLDSGTVRITDLVKQCPELEVQVGSEIGSEMCRPAFLCRDLTACRWLKCAVLDPCRLLSCGVHLVCGPRLYHAITDELLQCGPGFFRVCGKFGEIVGPICPFDPVDKFKDWRIQVQIEQLEGKVKELEARLAKR